jgi:hypothetical protein
MNERMVINNKFSGYGRYHSSPVRAFSWQLCDGTEVNRSSRL